MKGKVVRALPKAVLAIVGIDGAGKGTVIRLAKDLFEQQGFAVLPIGKADSPITQSLTAAIQRKGEPFVGRSDTWCPEAQVLTRFARDGQRAHHAREFSGQIVLLDRFVETSLGYAAYYGCSSPWLEILAKKISKTAALTHTLHCDCPFDVAWDRVQERARRGVQVLSEKEKAGPEIVRRLGELAAEGLRRYDFLGDRISIDTSLGLADTRSQVALVVEQLVGDINIRPSTQRSGAVTGLSPRRSAGVTS